MNIVIWVLQALLTLAFVAHGYLLLAPPAAVAAQMNAVLPRWFQVFIGVAEVLAAIGLILPGLTRILPWLVQVASGGLMIIMISATILHLARGEIGSASTTLVLLAVTSFVTYMRWRVVPIKAARGR